MEQYNDEILLKDILIKLSDYKAYLLKNKFAIIALSLTFCVLGLLLSITSDKQYNAELTFVVEDPQSGSSLGAMSGIASQFGFDVGGSSLSTFSQNNILELLKSRGVVESTLMTKIKIAGKEDLLIEHYLKLNGIKEDWAENPNFDAVDFHNKLTYIHDSISGNIWKRIAEEKLVVEMQSDEANIISLSYFSVNEEFAKQFVEVLIDQMSKMYVVHQTAQAKSTLYFLKERADSVFSELELAEEKFAKAKDINQRIVKASGRLKELQLMRRVEVLNTMYLEIIKNLELSKITLLNNTPIINIIDKPILPLEEDKPSKALSAILGAFLGGFLSISFFAFGKLFKDALAV
jgi:uncharacterized protein involved in exopolysaccharide biosynthesis